MDAQLLEKWFEQIFVYRPGPGGHIDHKSTERLRNILRDTRDEALKEGKSEKEVRRIVTEKYLEFPERVWSANAWRS